MSKNFKTTILFMLIRLCLFDNPLNAQSVCNSSGNIAIFSNYDGGIININVDQNIPNLIIAVCTYEPVQINIIGPFASTVSQVIYAGFNSNQNNNNCSQGNFTTSVSGVNQAIVSISPPNNPPLVGYTPNHNNGSGPWGGTMVGVSGQCDTLTNAGGGNTPDEVVYYFTNQTGGQLLFHNTQYGCWLNQTFNISGGGNCCIQPPCSKPPTPIISQIIAPGCISSAGSVSLSGLPSSVGWTLTTIPQGLNFIGTGTTAIFGGLLSGNTYSFVVNTASNCPSNPSAPVTIPPQNTTPPNVAVNQNGNISCTNSLVVLTASSSAVGVNYFWNSSNSSNANYSVNSSGNYSLVVTNTITGCFTNTVINVTIDTLKPQLSFLVPQLLTCKTFTTLLTSISTGGNLSYIWLPGGANTPTLSVNSPGTYTLTATNLSNGCNTQSVISVFQNILQPSINILPTNTLNCKNLSVPLIGTTSVSGAQYEWKPINISTATTSVSNPGTYTLFVLDTISGCKSNKSIIVEQESELSFTASVKGNLCPGGTILFNSTSASSYEWKGPNSFLSSIQNPSITNLQLYNSGTYTLSITSADNCQYKKNVQVNVNPSPNVDFDYYPVSPIINQNDEVVFLSKVVSGDVIKWDWFLLDQQNATLIKEGKQITHIFKEAGLYPVALVGTNAYECTDTVIKTVIVRDDYAIFIPNAFTPNNDGLNDIFQPKGQGFNNYTLMVFDKWGELIYNTNSFEKGWDGYYKGVLCKEDVYHYKINLTDYKSKSHEYVGSVTLLKPTTTN